MKKLFVLISLVSVLGLGQLSALGIGASVGAPIGSGSINPGVALSLKLDQIAPLFGFSVAASGESFNLGLTADWWMAEGNLIDFLGYYLGPGAFVGISNNVVNVGARIPVGLNAYLLDKQLEFFLEVAPALGLDVSPFNFPTFTFQSSVGFRFWFN